MEPRGGHVDIFKRGSVEHNLQSIYYYDIGAEVSGSHDVPGRRQGVGRSGGWQWAGPAPGPRRARRAPFPEARERRESGRGTRDETPAAPAAPPPRCRAPRTARVKNLRGGSSLRPCLAGRRIHMWSPLGRHPHESEGHRVSVLLDCLVGFTLPESAHLSGRCTPRQFFCPGN